VKTTVAIVAMGEMGSAIGKRLVAQGARVLTSLQGRSRASAERAEWAAAETVENDGDLASQADFILSVVPPSRAADFAARMLPHIGVAARKPVFVDCNAVSPARVREIAAPFQAAQLPFVDAGIVGLPWNSRGDSPRFYASGDAADCFAGLCRFGLDIRVLSNQLGDASALKMTFSGTTKSVRAVGAVLMLASMRHGFGQALWQEMHDREPVLLEYLSRLVPRSYSKAYRFVGEMEEAAQFLEPDDVGGSEMLKGAARLFADLAEDYAKGPNNGRIALLNEFIGQKEPQD
jgi:L-threonate 2-dehydrogenase